MADRATAWIALSDLLLCVVAVALVAVNPPKPKAEGVEQKAELLATVDWPVDIDADVDIHMRPPSHRPVFYGARDVGCARLDTDNRGFMDEHIALADGSTTTLESSKETISLRCIEPGHYDIAVNLYQYRDHGFGVNDRRGLGLKVHVEIVKLNPAIKILFARDVTLDHVGQTTNWASFDMARDGSVTLADPPLEPITHTYQTVRP